MLKNLICPRRLFLSPGGELRGDLGDAVTLEARGVQGRLVGAGLPVVALEGDAVGVAGLELGVRVKGFSSPSILARRSLRRQPARRDAFSSSSGARSL